MAPRLSKVSPPPPQSPQEAVEFLAKKLEPCVHRLSEALTTSWEGCGTLFAAVGKEFDRVAGIAIKWTKCFDIAGYLYDRTPLHTSLPIGFVLYLISMLYSSFVFFYLPAVGLALNSPTSLTFHTLIFFVLFNYMRAVKQDPGSVPNNAAWRTKGSPPPELTERKANGGARWCQKAGSYKPDRAHNCKVLGKCVLRMDHHCPWTSNTVGFYNHKYFFLFLLYVNVACGMLGLSLAQLLMTATLSPLTHILVMGSGCLTALLSSCLTPYFLFHCYLIANNMTTIEFSEKNAANSEEDDEQGQAYSNPYDIGFYHNICSVLGDNPVFWFLPFNGPSGDGLSFHTNAQRLSPANAERQNTNSEESANSFQKVRSEQRAIHPRREVPKEVERKQIRTTDSRAQRKVFVWGATETTEEDVDVEEPATDDDAADETESEDETEEATWSIGHQLAASTHVVDCKVENAWNLGCDLLSASISHFTSICVGDAKTKRSSLRRTSSILDVPPRPSRPQVETRRDRPGPERLKAASLCSDTDGGETTAGTDCDTASDATVSTATFMPMPSVVD